MTAGGRGASTRAKSPTSHGQGNLETGEPTQLPKLLPWNVRFSEELKEPAFGPRAFLAGKDARTVAEDLLAMEQADFSAAFRKSPMKRAKLAGLQRTARVVLGGNYALDGADARREKELGNR